MYQPVVLGEHILPNTGNGNFAFIAGLVTLLVGVAIIASTLLSVVLKRKASKA